MVIYYPNVICRLIFLLIRSKGSVCQHCFEHVDLCLEYYVLCARQGDRRWNPEQSPSSGRNHYRVRRQIYKQQK